MEVILGVFLIAAAAVLVVRHFFKNRRRSPLVKFDFEAAKSRETRHGSQLS